MTTPQYHRRTHRARRILDAVGRAYPNAWRAIDMLRRERGTPDGETWPDWCYIPIAAGLAIASGGGTLPLARAAHPAILTALATWRMTQGIYRYDPALYPALCDTPLAGDVPESVLYRLPEWCVYIETPGIRFRGCDVHGVWAHLECDIARGGTAELRLLLDTAPDPDHPMEGDALVPIPIILGGGTLADAMRRLYESAAVQARLRGVATPPPAIASDMATELSPLLALVLYLCSEAPDVTRRGQPGVPANPEPVRTRRDGWKLFPADGPREWDVGVRIGAALRAAYAREQTGGKAVATGRHVRPHVRRAHWHTILTGPRLRDDGSAIPSSERRADLRWMPPIPVAVENYDSLPATIRGVRPRT